MTDDKTPMACGRTYFVGPLAGLHGPSICGKPAEGLMTIRHQTALGPMSPITIPVCASCYREFKETTAHIKFELFNPR